MRSDDSGGRDSAHARILIDGSLLLESNQTGIATYTRALAAAARETGAHADLLLSGIARPMTDVPDIAMASQVFGKPVPQSRMRSTVTRLWRTRFGTRRRLTAYPVTTEDMAVETLEPRLPPHDRLFNANALRDHAQVVFSLRRRFTEVVLPEPFSAMHWAGPVPLAARGVPNIYSVHDLIPLRFPHFDFQAGGRSALMHAMIARRADHVITMSECSRDDLISILGLPPSRISVVYQHAVPSPALPQEEAERLVADLYDAEPGRYVLFCGAMEPKKNLYRLIEAFTLANTGQQLLLAGPLGWLYDDVQGLLGQIGAVKLRGTDKPMVRHLGYLPRRHVTALMQCCSFFAFPSLYEGFGLPVLEAMQLGVPVLTSNAGSLPEVAGDAAELVDPLNVPRMANAIRCLTADWDRRLEMAERGRRQAAKFSLAAHAEQLAAAYRAAGLSLPPAAAASAPALPVVRTEPDEPITVPAPVTHYGRYDIEAIRRTRRVDGIALVFFMGLGDYLLTTPMIEALRKAYPDLPIHGFASGTWDETNSPLVAGMLRGNPNIDRVVVYEGRANQHWRDYDYSDALKDVPPHFLVLPVVYNDIDQAVPHRVASLLQVFGLPQAHPVPRPVLYPQPLSAPAAALLEEIRARAAACQARGVVACHFDVRSSGYTYPHSEKVVRGLVEAGYFVVSFSRLHMPDEGLLEVDVDSITPDDTAGLLQALKSETRLRLLTVNSMLWAMSAGLDIPNLGLQNVHAPAMHQFHYPNTTVIANRRSPHLAPERLFVAPAGSFSEEPSPQGLTFVTFKPRFVLACFRRFALATETRCARPPEAIVPESAARTLG